MSATSISGVSFLNVDMKHCQYYAGGSDSALYTYQVSVQLKQGECLKTMESKSHTPFMDWLIDLYIDWSIDLLMDWLIFPGVKPLFKSFGNIGTWFLLIDWLIGWLCDWFQHGPVFAQIACLKQLKAVLLDCLLNWLIHWLLVEWLISVVNMVKSQLNRSLL